MAGTLNSKNSAMDDPTVTETSSVQPTATIKDSHVITQLKNLVQLLDTVASNFSSNLKNAAVLPNLPLAWKRLTMNYNHYCIHVLWKTIPNKMWQHSSWYFSHRALSGTCETSFCAGKALSSK